MTRGFTLLELVITISLCGILLAFAAPSFSYLVSMSKMKRLATEVNGFIIQAKSETVLRNKKLYAHFSIAENTENSTGAWSITLADSDDLDTANHIAYFDGRPFHGLKVEHTYSSQQIVFDEIRGRPKSGSFFFKPIQNGSNQLALKTSNPPGRVKVCGIGGEHYGYKSC
ncbi:GspH/FimT family pseudopilin [Vibrio sp. ZSDE26]|uniref:Type II secretion system protein H n=1 Tax=Vibrio amylolyticus TaxID=2847292 RepID=A0A9X2BL73_9VIBR|nr:GspH/FimT family pseudopilin [Vibrio amylolyticus]MCK6265357.1 GspH/FimT family pseudopilin [Vibrio amylolyticus]